MTAHAGCAVDDARQQRRAGKAGRHCLPAAFPHDVEHDEERNEKEAEQREWPVERHRRFRLRKTASERSQSPEVERTWWRMPNDPSIRSTSLRSSAAAAAN